MSENTVARKMFRPNMETIMGYWRKLHNKELYVLKYPSNVIWVIR
jgi:hypothetical protein